MMKMFLQVFVVILLNAFLCSVANAELILLSITGSWTQSDFYVIDTSDPLYSTGPDFDGQVFGVAPSDGSTTVDLLVDTNSAVFYPAGYTYTHTSGITVTLMHDFYGYTDVMLIDDTYTFGNATWDTTGIINLQGPDNLELPLWTDANIEVEDPSLIAFRMFGSAPGLQADFFAGQRLIASGFLYINSSFIIGEYYAGEYIRSQGYSAIANSLIKQVIIDIKPESYLNSVNPKNKGVIPIAIISTEEFDATTVDPLSVEFGPEGAMEAHGKGHIEDVDDDGYLDLVIHFNTQETGITCEDIEAGLIGVTFDGQEIEGFDTINTVGCN